MNSPYWSPYRNDILLSSRRLLTLMNRNPADASSGSFDRSFWHFKTADFSSATFQMGIGILAKLWRLEGSPYFQKESLLEWIQLGITQLDRIQHSDGSFDEWYVNERGWAGPTGYIMNACLDCYEIVHDKIDENSKRTLLGVINKGVDFLAKSDEGHMIANHVAIVLLPLIQAKHILERRDLELCIERLTSVLLDTWNAEEGWCLEYDGADPGYQSGTMSFLSKTLRYQDNPHIRSICEKSLEFISYFAFPSGVVGGAVGSRHTVTFFSAGIECLRHTPHGARLSRYLEEGLEDGKQVLGSDLDDHYLVYRLYEQLDAHFYRLTVPRGTESLLPWEGEDFQKTFKGAGLHLRKQGGIYSALALNKGLALRIEDIDKRLPLLVDGGVLLGKGKALYSSLSSCEGELVIDSDRISLKGKLVEVTAKEFSPLKFVAFRLFMLVFGFNHRLAYFLKKSIKSVLIFHSKPAGEVYERVVEFKQDRVVVKTILKELSRADFLNVGGEFWTRYVPQSRHFLLEQLDHSAPYYKESDIRGERLVTKEIGH